MPSSAKVRRRLAKKPRSEAIPAPTAILAIDVGGTKIKILATGQTEPHHIRPFLLPSREKVPPRRRGWMRGRAELEN